MIRWILFFVFVALIEIYAFQTVKTVFRVRWVQYAYIAISLFILLYIVYQFTQFDRSIGQNKTTLFTLGLLLITYLPKMVITVVMFGEDVVRVIDGLMKEFLGNSNESFLPERRKFVSQLALGLAAIPFLSLLYGMTKGKYNFKVIKQTILFPDLPDAFDGMTITQISDIHSGSFDNPEEIEHAIDLINQQNSDLILFTGDIVNTHATEMHPWIDTFKRIKSAPMGKYSVLGNHDYGEYVTWPSQADKQKNFEDIKDLHRQIGFNLMLNENVKLEKDGQQITLIGVENWGEGFKQAGDLGKAAIGTSAKDFKILMSHDPSHWEYEVKDSPNHYQLTLSGHTHGLQFGVEIPGVIKWSPVQYRYKQWAGLYENLGRYVYVNRGFGFHAYPGRVGIWPEITVLELKKA
ncbi:metallophosphoesterase [Flavobacterium suzhouense]|uniref:Metallophosphoesterase n=1 Tax=Flavobacterium suzhouense TaxID=1529638 RepID=A0ABW5NRT4_9FLAO